MAQTMPMALLRRQAPASTLHTEATTEAVPSLDRPMVAVRPILCSRARMRPCSHRTIQPRLPTTAPSARRPFEVQPAIPVAQPTAAASSLVVSKQLSTARLR